MQSKELAEKLRLYAHGGHVDQHQRRSPRWKGQGAFALFFADYLEKVDWSQHEKYDFWRIELYLQQLTVDAFEQLRIGSDVKTAAFRRMYEEETGHGVPNITDLGASYILDQGSAIQTTLGFMFEDILGKDWVVHQIDSYVNAQKYVLQQTFDKFLRRVYRRGLYDLIAACQKSGMSGKFGQTELRTFTTAGRLMFTFARRVDGANEPSVSFLAEDGDPLALSAGLQSVMADFRTCLDMVEEVIVHWPTDVAQQRNVFAASEKVSIM